MQFYGISCTHTYKQPAIDQTAFMDTCKKYHKTAFKSLPDDEQLDVQNMSKTL